MQAVVALGLAHRHAVFALAPFEKAFRSKYCFCYWKLPIITSWNYFFRSTEKGTLTCHLESFLSGHSQCGNSCCRWNGKNNFKNTGHLTPPTVQLQNQIQRKCKNLNVGGSTEKIGFMRPIASHKQFGGEQKMGQIFPVALQRDSQVIKWFTWSKWSSRPGLSARLAWLLGSISLSGR